MNAVDDPSRHEEPDDGLGGFVRRVFAAGPTPEERLEQLLASRRRELDETAARFDASIADLERREELLRDSRASVERMLRLGRSDLDTREGELTELLRELTERESRVAEAETDIARRTQELGAVELKRAAIERRERELDLRERELEERAAAAGSAEAPGAQPAPETVRLAFVPGTRYALLEVELPFLVRGATVEIAGMEYEVARIGLAPLPGDRRRCAYLTRGALPRTSAGSS